MSEKNAGMLIQIKSEAYLNNRHISRHPIEIHIMLVFLGTKFRGFCHLIRLVPIMTNLSLTFGFYFDRHCPTQGRSFVCVGVGHRYTSLVQPMVEL